MSQSIDNEKISQLASQLNATHEPQRDLWPEIEDQIKESNQINRSSQWMPFALAASLLISAISMGFSGYLYINRSSENNLITEQSPSNSVAHIEQSYMIAKATYLTELATHEQQLNPEIRQVLRKNLEIIDKATIEIHTALKTNPNDMFLMEALVQTRNKEIELLRQVASQPATTI